MKKLRFSTLIFSFLLPLCSLAQSKFDVVRDLQDWRSETSERRDLVDFEKDLRISFINRLIFQTERQFEGSLKAFMIQALKNLKSIDRSRSNQSMDSSEFFISNLLISIQENLEPTEDLIAFIKSYMNFSGLSEPAGAEEFGQTRNYINGDELVFAEPLDIEEASSLVASRIEQEEENELQLKESLLGQDLKFSYPPEWHKF